MVPWNLPVGMLFAKENLIPRLEIIMVANQQVFRDLKTGRIYSMKRINGVMVILETKDGLSRILTRQDDLEHSFQKITENEPQEQRK